MQEIGKPDIFHVKRRAEQLIFIGEAFIDVCLVQLRLSRDGFGGSFLHTVPRHNADGTLHKCLFHAFLFQIVILRRK